MVVIMMSLISLSTKNHEGRYVKVYLVKVLECVFI